MFASSVCMQLFNYINQKENVDISATEKLDGSDNKYTISYDGLHSLADVNDANFVEWSESYVNGTTVNLPAEICGSFKVSYATTDESYGLDGALENFRQGMNEELTNTAARVKVLSGLFTERMLTPLPDNTYPSMHEQATVIELKRITMDLRERYKSIHQSLVAQYDPINLPEDSTLTNSYSVEMLEKYGTAYLGVYFWEFSNRQQVFNGMTKTNITYNVPSSEIIYKKMDIEVVSRSEIYLNNFFEDFGANDGAKMSGGVIKQGEVISSKELAEHLQNPAEAEGVVANMIKWVFVSEISETGNPIQGLVSSANSMLDTVETIYAIITASKIGFQVAETFAEVATETGKAGGVFGIPVMVAGIFSDKALEKIIEFLSGLQELLWPVILGLIFIAFWIPLLPLIHWISGLMGFFIVFSQALILTPLLALSHLMSTEKTFLNSKTQHGYMSIIQLVTYLPIMVMSFYLAYFIGTIGLNLLNILYIPAISRIESDWLGIIKLIVYIASYYIISIQILNRAFSLITTIPEKSGKFIGGGEEMLGDSADQSKNSFVAVGANMKSGADKAKQTRDQNRQAGDSDQKHNDIMKNNSQNKAINSQLTN